MWTHAVCLVLSEIEDACSLTCSEGRSDDSFLRGFLGEHRATQLEGRKILLELN